MNNKPAKTFREGAIGVSVWERQGKNGAFYDFTVSRSYKDGENGSAYAATFRADNTEAIVRVIGEAAVWIRERSASNGQPDAGCDEADTAMSGSGEATYKPGAAL